MPYDALHLQAMLTELQAPNGATWLWVERSQQALLVAAFLELRLQMDSLQKPIVVKDSE